MDAEKLLQAFSPEETQELVAALPIEVLTSEVVRRGGEVPEVVIDALGCDAVEGASKREALSSVDTKESLFAQLPSARAAYGSLLDSLNESRSKKERVELVDHAELERELSAWLTEEKVAYVAAAQEADPEVRFTLVATPNVLVDDKELAKVAKEFGKNQPYETYVWDPLYSRYTPEQLSGTDPSNGNAVVFSLIPSKYTPDMDGTVVEQRAKLAGLQGGTPDLKVPSPLEAVTYWQALRTQGYKLADNFTFDRTYIRHFDLPEQRFDGSLYVPYSWVGDDGGPGLSGSRARLDFHARVAVG